MTTEQMRADTLELQATVDRLRKRQNEVEREIDECAGEVRRGDVPGSLRLNQLAVEKGEIDRELGEAEKKLVAAQVELREARDRDRTTRFHEVIALIAEHRDAVISHVREAAVSTGAIYELLKEARDLTGGLNSPLYFYVREAEKPVKPYDDWFVKYLPAELDGTVVKILPVTELGHPTSHPMLARRAATGAAFEKV